MNIHTWFIKHTHPSTWDKVIKGQAALLVLLFLIVSIATSIGPSQIQISKQIWWLSIWIFSTLIFFLFVILCFVLIFILIMVASTSILIRCKVLPIGIIPRSSISLFTSSLPAKFQGACYKTQICTGVLLNSPNPLQHIKLCEPDCLLLTLKRKSWSHAPHLLT